MLWRKSFPNPAVVRRFKSEGPGPIFAKDLVLIICGVQLGAPPGGNRMAFRMYALIMVALAMSHQWSLAAEIPNFNMRTCSTDKRECYEIKSPSVAREEGQSVYTFDEAELRILSKTNTGYKVLEVMKANRGTLDLSRGVVSLNEEDGVNVEQNLRSGRRSRN